MINVLSLVPEIVSVRDVPRVLRAIADKIEQGAYGDVESAAIVTEDSDGNVRTFGAGGADYYRAFALFHFGLANLTAKRGDGAML